MQICLFTGKEIWMKQIVRIAVSLCQMGVHNETYRLGVHIETYKLRSVP